MQVWLAKSNCIFLHLAIVLAPGNPINCSKFKITIITARMTSSQLHFQRRMMIFLHQDVSLYMKFVSFRFIVREEFCVKKVQWFNNNLVCIVSVIATWRGRVSKQMVAYFMKLFFKFQNFEMGKITKILIHAYFSMFFNFSGTKLVKFSA